MLKPIFVAIVIVAIDMAVPTAIYTMALGTDIDYDRWWLGIALFGGYFLLMCKAFPEQYRFGMAAFRSAKAPERER